MNHSQQTKDNVIKTLITQVTQQQKTIQNLLTLSQKIKTYAIQDLSKLNLIINSKIQNQNHKQFIILDISKCKQRQKQIITIDKNALIVDLQIFKANLKENVNESNKRQQILQYQKQKQKKQIKQIKAKQKLGQLEVHQNQIKLFCQKVQSEIQTFKRKIQQMKKQQQLIRQKQISNQKRYKKKNQKIYPKKSYGDSYNNQKSQKLSKNATSINKNPVKSDAQSPIYEMKKVNSQTQKQKSIQKQNQSSSLYKSQDSSVIKAIEKKEQIKQEKISKSMQNQVVASNQVYQWERQPTPKKNNPNLQKSAGSSQKKSKILYIRP